MAGMSLGPSTGFWNRIKTNMPGALTSMAGNMGPSMMRGNTPMMPNQGMPRPTMPNPMPKSETPMQKGSGMPGNRGTVPTNGIVRPYSPFGNLPAMTAMNANPMMPQQPPQGNMGDIGSGLWGAYNRLSGLGPDNNSIPTRGLFF